MQSKNEQYFFHKTIIYDFAAEKSAILFENKSIELISIEYCCFHKCSAESGPAAAYLDANNISIIRTSFMKMKSYDNKTNVGASINIISSKSQLSFLSATKCQIKTHSNFLLLHGEYQISFVNNTHNPINHITFVYICDSENSEASYCNVCHNPSQEGVEFQSYQCGLCRIHHSTFAYNTCPRPGGSYGVVRIYFNGTMEASNLYFFKNDKLPLSQDRSSGSEVTLIAESIYTDKFEFYSVSPSNVLSVSSLPIHFGEEAAAVCMKKTRESMQRSKLRLSIAACFWICKPFCS